MKDHRQTIRSFILENFLFSDDESELRDSDSFQATRIIDSMGMMELIHFIEKIAGIKIPDEEMSPEHLDSVDRIVQYIEGKSQGRRE